MEDNFDTYAISIDTDVLYNDFDEVDLYGTKTIEDSEDTFGNEIEFE